MATLGILYTENELKMYPNWLKRTAERRSKVSLIRSFRDEKLKE